MAQSRKVWQRRTRCVFAIVLVAAILYVCIAPSVDLAPTALRALKAALVVLICLCMLRSVVNDSASNTPLQDGIANNGPPESAEGWPVGSLLDLLCARLC
jgi:hypothetical protein